MNSEFIKIFPATKELSKELNESLKNLFDEDEIQRLNASIYLERKARGNLTKKNNNWLTDTRAITLLLESIEKETNEKILENVIRTIGNISQRYKYYDSRILKNVSTFFNSHSIDLKLHSSISLVQFNKNETWQCLINILKESKTKKICHSIGLYVARYGSKMPKKYQNELAVIIEESYTKQKNADSKDMLIKALSVIGNKKSIDFIKNKIINNNTNQFLIDSAKDALKKIQEKL